jgi:hydrogenase small subunit
MLGTLIPSATKLGTMPALETIDERIRTCGISRRPFLVFCTSLMVAAPCGLALTDQASPEACHTLDATGKEIAQVKLQ